MNIIRGEYFPQVCTKVLVYYDELYCDVNSISDGDIVYSDTHHILSFKDILNQRKNLTIVTSNSDHCLYDGPTDDPNGINVLELTCWQRWFGQNSFSQKVIPIPIGFENLRWERHFGSKTKWLHEERENQFPATKMVYLNCNKNTSFQERTDCYFAAQKMKFITIDEPKLTYKEYLNRIKEHKFVLSPRGNGLDCHRTWEILMMKRIPIIKREGALEKLYKDIPVLFVDDWSDLNNMNLNQVYDQYFFDNQEYLEVDYWTNLI